MHGQRGRLTLERPKLIAEVEPRRLKTPMHEIDLPSVTLSNRIACDAQKRSQPSACAHQEQLVWPLAFLIGRVEALPKGTSNLQLCASLEPMEPRAQETVGNAPNVELEESPGWQTRNGVAA